MIYINTLETVISLEDSILTAFLHLIGFDIVFLYRQDIRVLKKYFNERANGRTPDREYKYDLQVPDLNSISFNNTRHTWQDKFFKRGN